jgi:hypothetical protein
MFYDYVVKVHVTGTKLDELLLLGYQLYPQYLFNFHALVFFSHLSSILASVLPHLLSQSRKRHWPPSSFAVRSLR